MNKKLMLSIALFSLIAGIILISSILNINSSTALSILFWAFLASLCESLPVYYAKDRSVSVTFAILLACYLNNGTYVASIVAALSSTIVFIKNQDGTYKHILNIPLYKTLINFSNYTISIFISGFFYDQLLATYSILGSSSLSFILILVFTFTVFFINSIIMSMYASLMLGDSFTKMWLSSALWALPNFIAISPIGFFIYKLYELPSGFAYILMLMGPLLLARYSFKLYLDSQDQYYKTIKTLTAAIEAKDKYTEGHSRRVEDYAERIAQRLKFTPSRIESIKVAALLHDIGKIGIEDSILTNPGTLSHEEWDKIKQHPDIGLKILEEVTFPKRVKDAILHHHEKYNGGGYPAGLKCDEIAIDAYILAAADAYDAMTSDRPYRKALPKEVAINILRNEKGSQFHPEIAETLIAILTENDKDAPEATPKEKPEATYAV